MKNFLLSCTDVHFQDIEDTIQDFIADKILEKSLLAKADSNQGSFRAFLRMSLRNYCRDMARKKNAKKRNPGPKVNQDLANIEDSSPGPDAQFDIGWARTIINQTIESMKKECFKIGRMDLWGIFELRFYLPILECRKPECPENLRNRFELRSVKQVNYRIKSAKKMFIEILHSVMEDTVSSKDEIDAEILDLIRALTGSHTTNLG